MTEPAEKWGVVGPRCTTCGFSDEAHAHRTSCVCDKPHHPFTPAPEPCAFPGCGCPPTSGPHASVTGRYDGTLGDHEYVAPESEAKVTCRAGIAFDEHWRWNFHYCSQRCNVTARGANGPCLDGLSPDGETCSRCGGNRAPSGIDGGTWVHYTPPEDRSVETCAYLLVGMQVRCGMPASHPIHDASIPIGGDHAFTPSADSRSEGAVTCPDCGGVLERVTNNSGWLNDDQFDSVKAGDFFCRSCKGSRGKGTHRYFWRNELTPAPAPASADRAEMRELQRDYAAAAREAAEEAYDRELDNW